MEKKTETYDKPMEQLFQKKGLVINFYNLELQTIANLHNYKSFLTKPQNHKSTCFYVFKIGIIKGARYSILQFFNFKSSLT